MTIVVYFCAFDHLILHYQVMVGMVSPSRPTSESNSACDNYVTMEDKVCAPCHLLLHSITRIIEFLIFNLGDPDFCVQN